MKRTFNTPSVKIVMFSAETVHTASILPPDGKDGKYAYENAVQAIGSTEYIEAQARKGIAILEMKK